MHDQLMPKPIKTGHRAPLTGCMNLWNMFKRRLAVSSALSALRLCMAASAWARRRSRSSAASTAALPGQRASEACWRAAACTAAASKAVRLDCAPLST
jgi:hypothetical protein